VNLPFCSFHKSEFQTYATLIVFRPIQTRVRLNVTNSHKVTSTLKRKCADTNLDIARLLKVGLLSNFSLTSNRFLITSRKCVFLDVHFFRTNLMCYEYFDERQMMTRKIINKYLENTLFVKHRNRRSSIKGRAGKNHDFFESKTT
jgi:hypothetical protein